MSLGSMANQTIRLQRWYMLCLVSFVAPVGIQTVLLPWLVVVEMERSGAILGLVQFCLQLPAILLVLLGGLLADRLDRAKILMVSHGIGALPPLVLAYGILTAALDLPWVIAYALAMGALTAFAQPARDGMLNQIAHNELQRAVTITMGLTFGGQVVGFLLGGTAEAIGPAILLLAQALIMLMGVGFAMKLLPLGEAQRQALMAQKESGSGAAILEGIKWVATASGMLPILLLVFMMSLLYGGAYMVLVPVVAKEAYGAGATEIAQCFMAFVGGTILITTLLVKIGGLKHPLRAFPLALIGGGFCLILAASASTFEFYLASLVLWGMCGAVAMSMSRTLLQQAAPEAFRSRVLAIFSLANLGGMPVGGLILGFSSVSLGAQKSLWVVALTMFIVVLIFQISRSLWRPSADASTEVV
jgi:MFS family permease